MWTREPNRVLARLLYVLPSPARFWFGTDWTFLLCHMRHSALQNIRLATGTGRSCGASLCTGISIGYFKTLSCALGQTRLLVRIFVRTFNSEIFVYWDANIWRHWAPDVMASCTTLNRQSHHRGLNNLDMVPVLGGYDDYIERKARPQSSHESMRRNNGGPFPCCHGWLYFPDSHFFSSGQTLVYGLDIWH